MAGSSRPFIRCDCAVHFRFLFRGVASVVCDVRDVAAGFLEGCEAFGFVGGEFGSQAHVKSCREVEVAGNVVGANEVVDAFED